MLSLRNDAARRSRRRRGAALLEAAIALVTIAVLFAGVRFFHSYHVRKGESLREARYAAWTATRTGCDKGSTVRATEARAVEVPVTVRHGVLAAPSLEVRASMAMACNEEPFPNDDLLSTLEWVTGKSANELLEPAVDAVQGLFRF